MYQSRTPLSHRTLRDLCLSEFTIIRGPQSREILNLNGEAQYGLHQVEGKFQYPPKVTVVLRHQFVGEAARPTWSGTGGWEDLGGSVNCAIAEVHDEYYGVPSGPLYCRRRLIRTPVVFLFRSAFVDTKYKRN